MRTIDESQLLRAAGTPTTAASIRNPGCRPAYSYRLGCQMSMVPCVQARSSHSRLVTTILQDADGLHLAVDSIRNMLKDVDYDVVVGPESRGFIFGVPVAYAEHKGFVPVRKKGKLPCETVSVKYALEYGTAEIEMHKDSITPGQKVVIIDDLIATGGTTEAIIKLIEGLGGKVVKICFVMELAGLKGRELLKGYDVDSAIIYDGK